MNMTYVYHYNTKPKILFGVENPLLEYDFYQLATLSEVMKHKWATEEDHGRTFVLAEGAFLFTNGTYAKVNQ